MATPENANEGCVGPASESAGKASACSGCPNQKACASGEGKKQDPAVSQIAQRLSNVKNIILVLSGKGGVGKSSVSCQMAFALAGKGKQVGLLDVDICGPSVPRMLGLTGQEVHQSASGWSPVYVQDNLGVMSIGFMLPNEDSAIIWRGPRKNGLIQQFLGDVEWDYLDYLIIDTPPGTSDEHISIVQYLKEANVAGAVIVTTPQEVAMADVRKELNFCQKTGLPVVGVVENMSGFETPVSAVRFGLDDGSDATAEIFKLLETNGIDPEKLRMNCPLLPTGAGGPEQMAARFGAPYLGKIPMDPMLTKACEDGEDFLEAYPEAPAAAPFEKIIDAIVAKTIPRDDMES